MARGVRSPMPRHAGFHHPGSLVVAVRSGTRPGRRRLRLEPHARFAGEGRQGPGTITTVPQPNLNRCGADPAEGYAYAPSHGAHRADDRSAARLLDLLGPRGPV